MTNSTEAEAAAGVRGAIAAYAHALDDGRTEDLVALFCPDGTSDIAGVGTFVGRDAIRATYSNMVPTQPQRHMVANTVVTSSSEDVATASSDFAFFQRGAAGWSTLVVGRYQDTLHRRDGDWLFYERLTSYVM
ncbi:MAG: nuclear transport factor 2 family protein [Hyphomicrobiales bacterium]|nr:MAG: nuclear transport factor 2 family protein [Hyphomicrobiales bacterium]